MDAILPWKKLVRRIRPHDPKAVRGRQPHPLEILLQIHGRQHFFNLSDPAAQADPGRQGLTLWHEAAHRYRPQRNGAPRDGDACRRGRHQAAAVSAARRGAGAVGRPSLRERVSSKANPGKTLSDYQKRLNRSGSRARGEHPFRLIKPLWGFTKVRYRGIARNLARAQVAFALANLYALRRKRMPLQASCAG